MFRDQSWLLRSIADRERDDIVALAAPQEVPYAAPGGDSYARGNLFMSHFIDVAPTYAHDAPPAYVAYEDDDTATLVGTEPRAPADDCSGINDGAGGRCDAPRIPYNRSEAGAAVNNSHTHARASTDEDRSPNGGGRYGLDIYCSDRLYAAADDFDVRGLYAATDTFDIRAGDQLYAPADARHSRR
ncbi:hypothetical protein B0H15DRAFT_796923 [Mycena belliarum]|uniref:Uncharacterized protein n=1 Tax=Mycena belliarum TaxID=1033014 RepID=A0AAD6UCL2_9AGAR|nr:hypothetical protein B0H15DRAFT_796923 [Mycena belliae]